MTPEERVKRATILGNAAELAEALSQYPDLVNHRLEWGETLLHKAALYGNKDVLNVLVAHGADVNAKTNRGETPLHKAIEWHISESITILIKNSADLDAHDDTGKTPLMLGGMD